MGDASLEVDSESHLRRIRRSLFVSVLGLTFLHISALYDGNRTQVYLTKPTAMLLILILAGVGRDRAPSRYAHLILAGLACSLAGDVFLMLPSDQFIPGLVSFLIAHLFYITAFRSEIAGFGPPWLALPFCGYGLAAFWILSPGLGGLKLPVLAYLLVILIMAWQAAVRWNAMRDRSCLFALAGALLFFISDSVIAYNRFHTRFYLAEALIMSTYFAAQWLIALSVLQRASASVPAAISK